MIILIRHAQSEGNKNRSIHQMIPDHRVKLTDEGQRQVCFHYHGSPSYTCTLLTSSLQAVEAGRRLRSMLKPDDNIQFFTSPYRRTRETTEGILSSLTASDDESGPSVVMRQNPNNGKYLLENQLRTWSELKRKAANSSASLSSQAQTASSPSIPVRKWGGCQDGCNHHHSSFPRRRRNTQLQDLALPPAADQIAETEKEGHPIAAQQVDTGATGDATKSVETKDPPKHAERSGSTSEDREADKPPASALQLPIRSLVPRVLSHPSYGRDAGGSLSGAATPAEGLSDIDSDGGSSNPYFFAATARPRLSMNPSGFDGTRNAATASGRGSMGEKSRSKAPQRKPTEQDMEEWARQSGMGSGARADPLGDEADDDGYGDDEEGGEMDGADLQREESHDRSLRGSVY